MPSRRRPWPRTAPACGRWRHASSTSVCAGCRATRTWRPTRCRSARSRPAFRPNPKPNPNPMHMNCPELAGWRTRLAALAFETCGDDGAHDASHLERVWRNAQALLPDYPDADPLVVLAACYLHDLV